VRKFSTLVVMSPVAVNTVACGGTGIGLVTESFEQAEVAANAAATAIIVVLCMFPPKCEPHSTWLGDFVGSD